MSVEKARDTFKNPPMRCRPTSFWFWNDRLEPERLKWQFDQMVDAGMGGPVLHARSGLDPSEYLDDRWFKAIEAMVDHAAERGVPVWLYDELGWPSGTAGGRLPGDRPELGMVHLRMKDIVVDTSFVWDEADVVAVFHVTRTDPLHGFQRRHDGSVTLLPDRIAHEPLTLPLNPEDWTGERLLVFHKTQLTNAINYFDPKATQAFIESTHEAYRRRIGQHFGTTVTHTFMDETGMYAGMAALPWDAAFAETFETRRGYSLLPHLPALFFETPEHERIRFDFWSLAAELFREGFGIPMHEWHEAHGLAYSGHYLFEATLKEAIRQLGSTMPLYEYQGLPGIDILGNDNYSLRVEQEAYSYYVVTIKQASSVVHQLGKPGLMSESYGVGGNAMDVESMQSATNFQMALGVTFIIPHAAFYSLRGERKTDCPPIIGWQEPYWRYVKKHFDTTARTGWLLSQGKHVCDTLVLHPASSMQATYRHFRTPDEYKTENWLFDADMPFELVDKHFSLLSSALLDAQIDHDYGDEELMAKYGHVENGYLCVGEARYRTVLVPPSVNLRSTTFHLLREFVAIGGELVVVGSAPCLLDGKPSDEVAAFCDEHAMRIVDGVDRFDYQRVVERLTASGLRTITLETAAGESVPTMKVQRRVWNDREIVYVANVSREPVTATMTYPTAVTGRIEEWDLSSGNTQTFAKCTAGEANLLKMEWAPRQARAFVALPGEVERPGAQTWVEERRIGCEWIGQRTDENVIVLDECRVLSDLETARILSISEAQSALRKRQENQCGPTEFVVEYPFTISEENAITDGLELIVELAADVSLHLNGTQMASEPTGWFMDPAMKRIPLPTVRHGLNILRIAAKYNEASELQSPWIVGSFLAHSEENVTFTLYRDSGIVELGAWPRVGLPFYAGGVVYKTEADLGELSPENRVLLDLSGLKGSAQVRVNGHVVEHILWPPYECDLTSSIQPSQNEIEVEVVNTVRNLMGPHYEPREDRLPGMSDESYRGRAGEPKRFRDYGLTAPPTVVIERPHTG